jgi:hypothetical protein
VSITGGGIPGLTARKLVVLKKIKEESTRVMNNG